MDKLRDIHVALPERVLQAIDLAAKARGVKRAAALRLAVEELLHRWERERIDQDMRAYVEDMAPSSGEWVRQSGRDAARRLLEETEW